uniref:titin-like isoform X3 n=1 Tax=Ciona intestinalis TaxID=7719 RepID=UPI000EF4405B|nr:titin-like isoform X3 [Ciona intestinalis]|eukprot:XP_026694715.1 titin-like isoform X3 [Ciona intestinalis]
MSFPRNGGSSFPPLKGQQPRENGGSSFPPLQPRGMPECDYPEMAYPPPGHLTPYDQPAIFEVPAPDANLRRKLGLPAAEPTFVQAIPAMHPEDGHVLIPQGPEFQVMEPGFNPMGMPGPSHHMMPHPYDYQDLCAQEVRMAQKKAQIQRKKFAQKRKPKQISLDFKPDFPTPEKPAEKTSRKAKLGTKYNYEESKNLMDETNKLLEKHAAKSAARKIEIAEEKKKIEKMKKMQEEDRIEEMISEMSSVEEKPKKKEEEYLCKFSSDSDSFDPAMFLKKTPEELAEEKRKEKELKEKEEKERKRNEEKSASTKQMPDNAMKKLQQIAKEKEKTYAKMAKIEQMRNEKLKELEEGPPQEFDRNMMSDNSSIDGAHVKIPKKENYNTDVSTDSEYGFEEYEKSISKTSSKQQPLKATPFDPMKPASFFTRPSLQKEKKAEPAIKKQLSLRQFPDQKPVKEDKMKKDLVSSDEEIEFEEPSLNIELDSEIDPLADYYKEIKAQEAKEREALASAGKQAKKNSGKPFDPMKPANFLLDGSSKKAEEKDVPAIKKQPSTWFPVQKISEEERKKLDRDFIMSSSDEEIEFRDPSPAPNMELEVWRLKSSLNIDVITKSFPQDALAPLDDFFKQQEVEREARAAQKKKEMQEWMQPKVVYAEDKNENPVKKPQRLMQGRAKLPENTKPVVVKKETKKKPGKQFNTKEQETIVIKPKQPPKPFDPMNPPNFLNDEPPKQGMNPMNQSPNQPMQTLDMMATGSLMPVTPRSQKKVPSHVGFAPDVREIQQAQEQHLLPMEHLHQLANMHPEDQVHALANMHPEEQVVAVASIHPEAQLHTFANMHPEVQVHALPNMHPEAQVHVLATMHPEDQVYALASIHPEAQVHALANMHPDVQPQALANLHPEHQVHALANMHPDDQIHLLDQLHPADQQNIINQMQAIDEMHESGQMHPMAQMHQASMPPQNLVPPALMKNKKKNKKNKKEGRAPSMLPDISPSNKNKLPSMKLPKLGLSSKKGSKPPMQSVERGVDRAEKSLFELDCEVRAKKPIHILEEMKASVSPIPIKPLGQEKEQSMSKVIAEKKNPNEWMTKGMSQHQRSSLILKDDFISEEEKKRIAEVKEAARLEEHKREMEMLKKKKKIFEEQKLLERAKQRDIEIKEEKERKERVKREEEERKEKEEREEREKKEEEERVVREKEEEIKRKERERKEEEEREVREREEKIKRKERERQAEIERLKEEDRKEAERLEELARQIEKAKQERVRQAEEKRKEEEKEKEVARLAEEARKKREKQEELERQLVELRRTESEQELYEFNLKQKEIEEERKRQEEIARKLEEERLEKERVAEQVELDRIEEEARVKREQEQEEIRQAEEVRKEKERQERLRKIEEENERLNKMTDEELLELELRRLENGGEDPPEIKEEEDVFEDEEIKNAKLPDKDPISDEDDENSWDASSTCETPKTKVMVKSGYDNDGKKSQRRDVTKKVTKKPKKSEKPKDSSDIDDILFTDSENVEKPKKDEKSKDSSDIDDILHTDSECDRKEKEIKKAEDLSDVDDILHTDSEGGEKSKKDKKAKNSSDVDDIMHTEAEEETSGDDTKISLNPRLREARKKFKGRSSYVREDGLTVEWVPESDVPSSWCGKLPCYEDINPNTGKKMPDIRIDKDGYEEKKVKVPLGGGGKVWYKSSNPNPRKLTPPKVDETEEHSDSGKDSSKEDNDSDSDSDLEFPETVDPKALKAKLDAEYEPTVYWYRDVACYDAVNPLTGTPMPDTRMGEDGYEQIKQTITLDEKPMVWYLSTNPDPPAKDSDTDQASETVDPKALKEKVDKENEPPIFWYRDVACYHAVNPLTGTPMPDTRMGEDGYTQLKQKITLNRKPMVWYLTTNPDPPAVTKSDTDQHASKSDEKEDEKDSKEEEDEATKKDAVTFVNEQEGKVDENQQQLGESQQNQQVVQLNESLMNPQQPQTWTREQLLQQQAIMYSSNPTPYVPYLPINIPPPPPPIVKKPYPVQVELKENKVTVKCPSEYSWMDKDEAKIWKVTTIEHSDSEQNKKGSDNNSERASNNKEKMMLPTLPVENGEGGKSSKKKKTLKNPLKKFAAKIKSGIKKIQTDSELSEHEASTKKLDKKQETIPNTTNTEQPTSSNKKNKLPSMMPTMLTNARNSDDSLSLASDDEKSEFSDISKSDPEISDETASELSATQDEESSSEKSSSSSSSSSDSKSRSSTSSSSDQNEESKDEDTADDDKDEEEVAVVKEQLEEVVSSTDVQQDVSTKEKTVLKSPKQKVQSAVEEKLSKPELKKSVSRQARLSKRESIYKAVQENKIITETKIVTEAETDGELFVPKRKSSKESLNLRESPLSRNGYSSTEEESIKQDVPKKKQDKKSENKKQKKIKKPKSQKKLPVLSPVNMESNIETQMAVAASPPCTKTVTSLEESQSEVEEKYSEPKFSEPDFKVIYDGASNKSLTATEAESEHSVPQMKQMAVVASPPCTKTATSTEESQSEVEEKYSEPKFSEPDFKVIYDGASNKPLTATEAESEHSVSETKLQLKVIYVASSSEPLTATEAEDEHSVPQIKQENLYEREDSEKTSHLNSLSLKKSNAIDNRSPSQIDSEPETDESVQKVSLPKMAVEASPPCTKTATSPEESQSEVEEKLPVQKNISHHSIAQKRQSIYQAVQGKINIVQKSTSSESLTATEAESEHLVPQVKEKKSELRTSCQMDSEPETKKSVQKISPQKKMAVVASPPCTKTATSTEESQSEVEEKLPVQKNISHHSIAQKRQSIYQAVQRQHVRNPQNNLAREAETESETESELFIPKSKSPMSLQPEIKSQLPMARVNKRASVEKVLPQKQKSNNKLKVSSSAEELGNYSKIFPKKCKNFFKERGTSNRL